MIDVFFVFWLYVFFSSAIIKSVLPASGALMRRNSKFCVSAAVSVLDAELPESRRQDRGRSGKRRKAV